jgi:flagellar basal body-associated protein FliL
MINDATNVTIGLVAIAFAVAAAAVLIALWVSSKIAEVQKQASEDAVQLAAELAAYKLHVAETYMSKASGGLAMDRAVTEIKGLRVDLKEELGKLGDRIERMENHVLSGR